MAMMSKLDAAYLAGLVDGEGYIGIMMNRRGEKATFHSVKDYLYTPVLKICMTDRAIIEWLYCSFGGTFEIRKARGNARESYGWMCRKAQVRKFLGYLYPYLRVKRKQAEVIFRYPVGEPGKPLPDEIWRKRDELYGEIRALNKTGTVRD